MTAPESRKRLPSADRRQQILQASAALFIERGYDAVGMGDIAGALGVSRPTIYSYFSSTDDILGALLDERLGALLSRLDPLLGELRPGPSRGAAGPQLIETVFRFLQGERDTLALLHSGGGPAFRARRQAFLGDLGRRLQLDPDLLVRRNPALMLIVTTLLDSLAFRAGSDPNVDVDDLARHLGAFVLGGVRGLLEDGEGTPQENGAPSVSEIGKGWAR